MGNVILVTGANGFIGKRLIERLIRANKYEIVAVGRSPELAASAGKRGFRYIQADLSTPDWTNGLDGKNRYDAVIHLAAMVSLQDSPAVRLEMYRTNVTATLGLLELVSDQRSKLVFASTGMVYGDQPGPFREDMITKPANFYALTKLLGEEMIKAYSLRHGFKYVIYRTSIIYGPGQASGMFIPSMIEALVSSREFSMTEGKQVRDFLYVDDCARALEMASDSALEGTFNLASGVRSTLLDTGKFAGEVTGAGENLRPGALPYRPNELWEYFMDIGKLSKALGWRPEIGLKEGLERVAQYEKSKIK